MKTKSWMFILALVAAVACGTVAFSYAQNADATPGPGPGWHEHMKGHMGWMGKELNLTDAQKAQIKSMMQAQRSSMHPLMQQMAQTRLAMLQATSNGAFDQAKVTALANQQAQLQAQLTVQRESMQHQVYTQVLTADQRTKADQMRQQKISRMTEHMQKMEQRSAVTPAE